MISLRSRPGVLSVYALAVGITLGLTGCGDGAADDGAAGEGVEQNGDQNGEQSADQDSDQQSTERSESDEDSFARADLADAAGNEIGTVTFSEVGDAVQIHAELHDLQPGFRGLHVHEVGVCEPQSTDDQGEVGDFFSAGGHLPGHEEEDLGVVEGEEAPETEGAEGEGEEAPAPQEQQDLPDEDSGADHPDHAGDLPNILVVDDGTAQLTVVTDRLTPELLREGEGAAVIVHAQADNHGNIPERYAPFGLDADTSETGDSGERSACGVVEGS